MQRCYFVCRYMYASKDCTSLCDHELKRVVWVLQMYKVPGYLRYSRAGGIGCQGYDIETRYPSKDKGDKDIDEVVEQVGSNIRVHPGNFRPVTPGLTLTVRRIYITLKCVGVCVCGGCKEYALLYMYNGLHCLLLLIDSSPLAVAWQSHCLDSTPSVLWLHPIHAHPTCNLCNQPQSLQLTTPTQHLYNKGISPSLQN